jgi:hypothetical protein
VKADTNIAADRMRPSIDPMVRAFRLCAIALLVLVPLLLLVEGQNLSWLYFQEQDAIPLLVIAIGYAALARWAPSLNIPTFRDVPIWSPPLVALLMLVATATGAVALFSGYALTRDELLVEFDADFLRLGQIIAPVPTEWRAFADAMMPSFMLPIPGDAGWTSSYLPVNAAIRALVSLVIDPIFTGSLLAGVAIVALYGVARQLWPEQRIAAALPVILLATSSQMVVTAMTPYAMTAHLALNLLWLQLYLRDDGRGDAGAIAMGFLATGLHQIVFHPLFVAPFILDLLLRKRWRRAILFMAAYAGIGLFWACYWQIAFTLSDLDQVAGGAAAGQGLPYFLNRVAGVFGNFNPGGIGLMALNLLRFLAWQNPLLLPLALLAAGAIKRGDGIARALALGVLLNLAAMLILLPYQGHGWGYRYLHGFLGSFCLLATYGLLAIWQGSSRQRAGAALIATSLAAIPLMLLHMKQAHDFVRPYRAATALIAQTQSDIVLVDGTGLLFAADLVRNRPDAGNRPIVMELGELDETQLRKLCTHYRVAVFDRLAGRAAGIPASSTSYPYVEIAAGRRAYLGRIGCGSPVPITQRAGA